MPGHRGRARPLTPWQEADPRSPGCREGGDGGERVCIRRPSLGSGMLRIRMGCPHQGSICRKDGGVFWREDLTLVVEEFCTCAWLSATGWAGRRGTGTAGLQDDRAWVVFDLEQVSTSACVSVLLSVKWGQDASSLGENQSSRLRAQHGAGSGVSLSAGWRWKMLSPSWPFSSLCFSRPFHSCPSSEGSCSEHGTPPSPACSPFHASHPRLPGHLVVQTQLES